LKKSLLTNPSSEKITKIPKRYLNKKKMQISYLILTQMQNSNNSNNYPNTGPSKLRGKLDIDMTHRSISKEDERRINIKISNFYGVGLEEAKEIHINYHSYRIFSFLLDRAKKQGMTEHMFVDLVKDLNLQEYAYRVSTGELIEMAAVDLLYKILCYVQNDSNREDRYINFYG
jgi:hypothetical protein